MEPIRTNDPALQDPTTPVARQGAPEYPATSSRRQPAPNQLQSAESAVPPAQPSGAEGANDQTSNPPNLQPSEEQGGNAAMLLYIDAKGRSVEVAPHREQEFLATAQAQGLAPKRATRFRDDRGRTVTVALDRRQDFLNAAHAQGLTVTELTPAGSLEASRLGSLEEPRGPEPVPPPPAAMEPEVRRPGDPIGPTATSGGNAAQPTGRGAAPHPESQASNLPSLQPSEGGGNAAQPTGRGAAPHPESQASKLPSLQPSEGGGNAALQDFAHRLYDDGALRAQTFAQYMQRQGWNITVEGNRVTIPTAGTRSETLEFLPEGGIQSPDPALQSRLQADTFMRGRGFTDGYPTLLHPVAAQAVAFNDAVHQANLPRLYKLQADIAKHGAWGMPAPHVEMPDFGGKPFPQILLDAVADTGKAGWNSVVELGKGVVAIPTLSAQFGEWLSRQAGWTDEHSARLSDYGVETLRLIDERLRAEYSWQDDPAREDPYGAKQTIAGIGEFMAQIGLASLASKGTGAAAKQTVKQTAGETAEGAAKQAAQKAAQETPESLAAVSAREAAERTAQSTVASGAGEVSSAAVTREFGQNFMEIYGGKLRHKAMMDSLREFGNVKYISFSVSANSAIQVGNQYLASGRSRDEAFVAEVADFLVMLLTAQAGDAFGAYVLNGSRQGVVGWAQAMALGAKNPATKAAIGQGLISAFANGTSNAAGDLFHTYMMMRGGAEITESDIWSIGLTSFLFGATAAGVLNLPAIRQANLADKKMMADLIAAKQDLSALATDNVYGGWIQIPDDAPLFTVGDTLATNTGKPQTLKDISLLSRPVAVNPSGYVLFNDGIIYRPGSDDFLTLDGRVFDRNANCTGVVGPRQDPIVPIAKPDTPTAPEGAPPESPAEQPGAEHATQDDLFGGEAATQGSGAAPHPQSQASNPPSLQASNESVRALSLYRLLQTSDAQVYNVRVADILVNKDVKQFKAGADPNSGVVAGEELHGEFQKIPAKPIVVLQKRDGTLEVVTGRHRLDLARRNGLETIPANIIKEADGWTPESAALLDAFDNILDEKGSYADYVPFFRKAGIPREVAEAYGLLARPKGRISFEIAMNGTDDLVSFVAAGDKRVTPDVAAAICRAVPVPAAAREAGTLTGQAARYDAIQHYVMRAVIDEGLRADQAEIMANGIRAEYAKRAEAKNVQQDDLFGFDETFNTEMALRAKYAGDQIARINLDLRALKIVSGKQSGNVAAKDTLLKKYNIKGPDDAAGIERAIQDLETLHHRWQNYFTDAELSKEADAFVKRSLRLDPEDQSPIPLDPKGNPITPESQGSGAAPHQDANQPISESANQPAAPAASLGSPTTPGGEAAQPAAVKQSKREAREAQRARMVTTHDLGLGGLTDEESNGPDFTPLAEGENFDSIRTAVDTMRKGETSVSDVFGIRYKVKSGRDAGKTANYTKEGEDARAHQYAAKNVIQLAKRAGVAVRQDNYKPNSPNKTYVRLFAPYFFENRLYIAVIAQYEADVNGVHAVEALDVIRADVNPEVISRDPLDGLAPTGTQSALDTISIPQKGLTVNELSLESIQRVIDNPKKGGNQRPRLLDPDGNGGLTETPCTAQDVADRIVADVAGFVGRARYRADHKLQSVDTDDVGRFTMGEGVTVEVSDGVAAVTGLAAKSPAEAAKLLDAIQAQLAPGVALAVTDRLAPDVQNLIQVHNENALTYRIWEAIDKYAKIDYRFEDGKHILTFPEKDTRTYQENAAIVKAVKALLPEGTPLTLENTKSRMLQALAAHTPTTDAQPTPVARQGVPESPASPESPARPSGVEDAELPDTPQAQRDAVRNLHQGRNTWLKAPNGKRTKLPQKLWVDVRTPNFKRFFGDWENHPETIHPKLLDENGEPRILWHYSDTPGIRAFDPTRSRAAMDIQGTYFSPDRQDAAGYGQNAYPVFIALKHPADQATAYAGFTPGSTPDAGAIRAQELRDQGYDGVIVEDSDAPAGIAEIIVLDPNAIKSAGRNAGAYDPSNPDILANPAPTAQGTPAPANPGAAQPDARSPGDPFSVLRSPFSIVNGADIVSAAVYPNGGRVPVAGSPAATAGTLPLSLPHAVQLFHLLTGKLPGVVAQKNKGPRNALGWYLPKTADVFVRAQLFGLIDQSDLTVLKDGLAKRGYFRHENPAWCATQTKDSIRREKTLSNQKLEKAADLLIRRRTRAGVHQGAAAKVMAHELWHAISASGGVPPRDHGNLLGQIYNLKKCMAKALPENTFATDDTLRKEAADFIDWWRGLGKHEPYFDQPHEAYAEMGAAFFLDPEAVKESAPVYYDAMLDGLRNYPQAFDALAAIRDQHAAGGDLDAFQQRLLTTWQAAHEARVRKLSDEVGKPTEDERNARVVQLYWNRYAPVMMILQRAQKDVRKRLRQDLKDGNITQADHDARIRELDEEQLDVRHHTLLFTHRHGPSKLFLADIWGRIGQQADALGVSMNDLNLYLHLRRVEELKGRATALGIDPPTARLMLNNFFKRLGYAKVRAIARLAKTFHAVWQHAILENPDVVAMLGPDKIAELKQNAHYITMRHVPTPEELQAATVAWEKTKRAKSGGDPLEPIVRELLGHKAYTSGIYGADAHTGVASALKRLEGSLRQTESPLTATAETGLAILEAAQRNALTVSLVRALKAVGFDEIAVLKPTDDVITNDRIGTVQYMENGKRVTLAAPRTLIDALSGAPHEIPYLTAATRFLSAGFTTNNPAFIIPAALRDLDSLYVQMPGMKRGFAQWCAAYANIIPGVGPLRYARSAVNLGNWVNWSAQFIPPHVMKRISQTPIGRLLYGQKTVAYWTSVGAKIARIIQHMDFEGTLRQAHEARLAGDDAKAEALEYCATMARHALEDGVLLTYNQQLADDYLKGGLQRLFDKYHLKYDDDRRYLPIPAKIAKRTQDYRDTLRQRLQRANAIKDPKKRMAALAAVAASPLADLYRTTIWEPFGFLSEYQSMMVKLAGWAYLHHESAAGTLPPLPTDPTGNTASQGATPVARQGAPFSVLRSPFSGGGEAASSGAYDASRRRQIALYAADRAGDPNFANKGMIIGQVEAFFTGFLNARMKGLSRTAARLKEAPGEFTLKALTLLAPSLLGYLLYDGTLKRAVQTLFFDGQEPDDEQLNTLAGNLYTTLAWEQDALKNVSPYTRLNYFTTPLWMSADKSVTLTLKTPIPEEIKPLHYALTALLNRTTLDTGMPNVGLNDALAEIYGNLAPGSGDRGVAIALLDTWAAPWFSGDNPWQSYRNANQFSDDAFRARLITPTPLIREQLIDTWNGSPLVSISRLRRNDQYGNVPQDLQALHALLQTPIVGPVLARFASIDSNGRAQTVSQYAQIAEARKAALRIQAKQLAPEYLKTNTLPDTLKDLPPEEDLYFIDALLDAVKDQALPKSTSHETLKKALNINFQDLRQPALRATQANP